MFRKDTKYHNQKTVVNGERFDSKAEKGRWNDLLIEEMAGSISDLRRQVKFVLIEGVRWSDGKKHRDTVYIADFVYRDNETGQTVVEDVKGYITPEYRIKRELMKEKYGIEIKEVRA